jgi:hypothetical protein
MPDETNPDREGKELMSTARVKHEQSYPHIKEAPAPLNSARHWLSRYGRLKIMAQTSSGEARPGLSIPYPILTGILTLFIWLAGLTGMLIYTLATLNANFANLNTSLTNRDAQSSHEFQAAKEETARTLKELSESQQLMQTYLQNDREKIIRIEAQLLRGKN